MRLSFRTLIPTLLILLICIVSCNNLSQKKNSLIKAIPTSAFVVMETQDIHALLSEMGDNEYLSRLTNMHQLENLKGQFSKLVLRLREQKIQLNLDEAVAFSIHKTGSEQSDLLFTTKIKESDFNLQEVISKLSNFTRVTERTYDENLIYSIDNEGLRFYFAYVNEYLFLTKNSGLISDAMRQCRAEHNLLDNSTFSKVYKTANQKDILNVFVHTDGLKTALTPHSRAKFRDVRNFSDWMALDLSLGDNYLLFNGISSTKDSLNSVHNYFKGQKAQSPKLFEIAPRNTEFLISYHFEEYPLFFRNKKRQLDRKGKFTRLKNSVKKLPINTVGLQEFLGEEFGYLMVGKKIGHENNMGIAKIQEANKFMEQLSVISDSLENYREYALFQLNSATLCEYLFGEDFRNFKRPYWTVIDNYWVFSISKTNLRHTINEHLLEHSLADQENFQKLRENLSNTSNIWMYGANMGNKSHFNQLLKKEYLPKWQKSITQLDYFEGWMLQMNNQSDLFNVNITTKLKEERAQTLVHSEWSINLDNPINRSIEKVWNHHSEEWELLIQDEGNIVYLLTTGGDIKWTKQLDEQILGKVHQVDLYKNKRLQMMFNTASKVYAIDRNGENVDGYPFELHDDSELGMAVFDYDNNRNYRLVIPTVHSLKMLDGKGGKVKGWLGHRIRPKTLTTPVHYSIKGKDYILTVTEKSEVLVLDRKGEERLELKQKFNVDASTKILLNERSKHPQFEFVDTTGFLVQIGLNGKVERSEFLTEGEVPSGRYLDSQFIIDDFELTNTDQNFSFDLGESNQYEIAEFKGNNEAYLAICLNSQHKTYLVDMQGEVVSGFPVYGNTGVFIDRLNDHQLNLIVGSKEGSLYKYIVSPTEE